MAPLAHGIDLVDVERVARLLDEHGDRALDRVFTVHEQACAGAGPRRLEHLAARFAAKEAALKALGTGWAHGIAWTDVEVRREDSGKPTIVLHGPAKALADSMGLRTWAVSLSHTQGLAVASVVAMG